NIGNNDAQADAEGKLRPWVLPGPVNGVDELDNYAKGMKGDNTAFHATKQMWFFRSTERGFWSRLNTPGWLKLHGAAQAANQRVYVTQRNLWAQEPALVDLRKPYDPVPPYGELLDLVGGRQMTMRRDEIPPEHTDSPPTSFTELGNQVDNIQSDQNIIKNNC